MGYFYNADDGDAMITVGSSVAALKYNKMISADDGYGGTNHEISIPGKGGAYHVHFNGTSRKVNVVRYKGSSTAQGTNLIKWSNTNPAHDKSTERKNLKELSKICKDYPNHAKLLLSLHEAVREGLK
jgi:hypothetical protein